MSKQEKIMEAVKKIQNYDMEDAFGCFGFVISDASMNPDNCYEDIGRYVIRCFNQYPEQADILDEMLTAICGWSISSLIEDMERKRSYYEAL